MNDEHLERASELDLFFSEAIRREREAQKLYRVALEIATDSVVREVLERILKEEERHEVWLGETYRRYAATLAGEQAR
ncbi:MAG: hypothetical protein V1750_04715 [Acidobacteriota bacterium]